MSMERDRWILRIKQLREQHNVGIFDAERLALADPEWRRWVERQINSDKKCRWMARYHMYAHGTDSLIAKEGERLVVLGKPQIPSPLVGASGRSCPRHDLSSAGRCLPDAGGSR